MYGYRNTNSGYHKRYQSAAQRHFTKLQTTATRMGLNPFTSKAKLPNGKPQQANPKAPRTIAAIALGTITVLFLLRSLFSGSSSTTISSYTIPAILSHSASSASLDAVIATDRDQRYQKLDELIENKCLSSLGFVLDESATDSLLTQFRTWMWHLTWEIPMSLSSSPTESTSFVITKHGTVLNANDELLDGQRLNSDFATCDLVGDMFNKLQEANLLIVQAEIDEAHSSDSFTTWKNQNHDDIWDVQYSHMYAMDNENKDAWTLLEQAVHMNDKDVGKHKALQVQAYKLLHSYCSNVFDHLSSNSMTGDFSSHEALVDDVTRHLYSIKYADYGISHSEVVLVGIDGALNVGHPGIELEGEYETCPLIQKLVTYQWSENGLKGQVKDVMKTVEDATYHRQHVGAFDVKIDVLMEEHCGEMVNQLEVSGVYHSVFRHNLYDFANDLSTHGVRSGDKFYVDVYSGDLMHQKSKKSLQCPLIDAMADIHRSSTAASHDYTMSKSSQDLLGKTDYAKAILSYAKSSDFANLRHILSTAIRKFYAPAMKQQMRSSYKATSDEVETRMETLAASMEQFVVDLLDKAAGGVLQVEKNVVMDVVSGIVVAVSDERLKSLTSNWIEVDVLEEVRKLNEAEQSAQSAKKTQPTKQTSKPASKTTKTTSKASSSGVSEFLETLRHDVKKMSNTANVMEEFDEDITYGLDTYCKSTMNALSSFGKRQLRNSVGSALVGKINKVSSPVVTSKGEIKAFSSAGQDQVFKCELIEALMA